jgi:hypothetical protein
MSANPFVDKAAQLLGNSYYECREAPDQFKAMANRLEEAQLLNRPVETVWSGYPVKVRRAGLMVELGNSALVKALLVELAMQARQKPEEVLAELLQIADLADEVAASHTVDSREQPQAALDAALDLLIDGDDDRTGLGGASQQLTLQDTWELGHRLIEHAGPRLPRQQHGKAA